VLGQKVTGAKMGHPLIYCGSNVCSGRVRALLYNALKKGQIKINKNVDMSINNQHINIKSLRNTLRNKFARKLQI